MTRNPAQVVVVQVLTVATILCAAARPATALEASLTRTNYSERWITNVIEVTVPINRFFNEYRTNQVELLRTNILDVFKTNTVTRTLTKQITVDDFLTNYVTAYQTNWKTLNLTNWETVLVMKTNWVTQPMTNVVQIDLPASQPAPAEAAAHRPAAEPKRVVPETLPAATTTGPLTLEVTRSARPAAKNLVPVQLKVRWTVDEGNALLVQQWRIEQENGGILCFGPTTELLRELSAGTYKVEVKVKKDATSQVLAARGTMIVTAREVVFKPTLTAKR